MKILFDILAAILSVICIIVGILLLFKPEIIEKLLTKIKEKICQKKKI